MGQDLFLLNTSQDLIVFKKRLNVKPGITGLAQINGRNNISWEKRFEYDIEYIDKKTALLDIKIIFKTLFVVISGSGVKSLESEIMPEFEGKNKSKNE